MLTSNYRHPSDPTRVIPLGEDPLVTKAKVCAQLRAALAEIESGDFGTESVGRTQAHLQAVQWVLFVRKTLARFPGLPAHLRVGLQGREVRA